MPVPIPPPPAVTIGGIACTVMFDGGITESIPTSGFEATVMLKCAWADRFKVYAGLRGTSKLVGGAIVRVPPFPYPDLPALRCVSVGTVTGIKMRRRPDGWPTYKTAIIPVNFGFPTFGFDGADPASQADPSGKAWTTTRFRNSSEVFTPPGGGFLWTYNGQPVEESALGLLRPRSEVSMTRHFLPGVPLHEAMSLMGSVNASPVAMANHIFPRGCLMLGPINSEPATDGEGNYCQDIEYLMLGNYQVEWNELMGRDGDWHLIADVAGNPPFPYANFWDALP